MKTCQVLTTLVVAALTATFALLATAQTPSFHGLGQMPGAMSGAGTFPQAISSDRSTIVGWAWVCRSGQPACTSSDKTEAFRWTATGKYQVLGDLGSSIGQFPPVSPAARDSRQSMVYNPATETVVLFGGTGVYNAPGQITRGGRPR